MNTICIVLNQGGEARSMTLDQPLLFWGPVYSVKFSTVTSLGLGLIIGLPTGVSIGRWFGTGGNNNDSYKYMLV